MPRWNKRLVLNNHDDRRIRAARTLLHGGMVTMAEAATLIGCTRQYIYKLTRDLKPVRRRAAYLKQLWREALDLEEA